MLLFFSCIFLIIFLFFLILRFGKLQIQLENFEKDYFRKNQKDLSSLKIAIYIFDKFKIFEIGIKEKGKMVHQKLWRKMKNISEEKGWTKKWEKEVKEITTEEKVQVIQSLWERRKTEIKIRKINMLVRFGIDDALLTSYLVSVLSIFSSLLLSIFGKEKWKNNYHYLIYPSYQGRFDYQFHLDISVRLSIWQAFKIVWEIYSWERKREKESQKNDGTTIAQSF